MFTFIESSIFERILPVYLDDDEYSELQQFLMQNEPGKLSPDQVAFGKCDGHGPESASEAD